VKRLNQDQEESAKAINELLVNALFLTVYFVIAFSSIAFAEKTKMKPSIGSNI